MTKRPAILNAMAIAASAAISMLALPAAAMQVERVDPDAAYADGGIDADLAQPNTANTTTTAPAQDDYVTYSTEPDQSMGVAEWEEQSVAPATANTAADA